MQSYTYKGKSKLYRKPVEKQSKNFLFKNMGFIICGSQPIFETKSYGNKLLYEYKNVQVLDYYLDLIHEVCEDPEIIITTGLSHKDFVKHERKDEFAIVENQMYEFSNSSEDLRIGLLALRSPHTVFIDSVCLPTVDTMRYLLTGREMSSKIFTKKLQDNYMGVTTGDKYISGFDFDSEFKLTGMYFINTNDIDRIRKKTISNVFAKNKFAFELLSDAKATMILDESNSVLVSR